MKAARFAATACVGAAFAAAVFATDDPASFAVGLAPLAWIALEGCWRLMVPAH